MIIKKWKNQVKLNAIAEDLYLFIFKAPVVCANHFSLINYTRKPS